MHFLVTFSTPLENCQLLRNHLSKKLLPVHSCLLKHLLATRWRKLTVISQSRQYLHLVYWTTILAVLHNSKGKVDSKQHVLAWVPGLSESQAGML